MVELFLRLIDRLTELLELRTNRVLNTFTEIYEPIFNDMLTIHQNYIEMFTETHSNFFSKQLESAPISIRRQAVEATIDMIDRERVKYEAIRRNVWSLSKELNEHPLDDGAQDFVQGILSYFPTHTPSDPLRATLGAELASLLNYVLSTQDCDVTYVQDYVKNCLFQIREQWLLISKTFAKLKCKAISKKK